MASMTISAGAVPRSTRTDNDNDFEASPITCFLFSSMGFNRDPTPEVGNKTILLCSITLAGFNAKLGMKFTPDVGMAPSKVGLIVRPHISSRIVMQRLSLLGKVGIHHDCLPRTTKKGSS